MVEEAAPLPPSPGLPSPTGVVRSVRASRPSECLKFTAMDLDEAHAPPKYSSAMEGLEKELWEKANSTEFIRHHRALQDHSRLGGQGVRDHYHCPQQASEHHHLVYA
ncbi:hypothetical protein EON64_07280 [archaeon]|nr:MAG: hypothetical protein EON64_07280 [archaeon]